MTAKELKEQEADEAIERVRRLFNDDGYARPVKDTGLRTSPHGDPFASLFEARS